MPPTVLVYAIRTIQLNVSAVLRIRRDTYKGDSLAFMESDFSSSIEGDSSIVPRVIP